MTNFKTMFCKNKLTFYSSVSVIILIFFFKQLSIYFSCFPFPKAHFFWLCSSFSILFARRKGKGESKELIKRKLHNHEVLHLASRTFNSWLSNFKYVFQIAYCDSPFPVPTTCHSEEGTVNQTLRWTCYRLPIVREDYRGATGDTCLLQEEWLPRLKSYPLNTGHHPLVAHKLLLHHQPVYHSSAVAHLI